MIKFSALNAADEVEACDTTKNKEELKSDAFQRYNSALAFIKNKENDKAETALKELLLHPYFDFDEETFSGSDFFNTPAVKLLTSIYKNLGKVHEEAGSNDEALECYLEAVSSDKTDITTWYNIANVYIKKVNYSLACDSLKECLNIDPSFWPSIDTLICLLYALGDYLSCLHLIQHSLSLNSKFERALCVKEEIKKEDPFLFKNFRWNEGLADLSPSSSTVILKEMKYPLELREKDQQATKSSIAKKTDPVLYLRDISEDDPLADLGKAITELFSQVKKEELSLFCPIDISKSNVSDIMGVPPASESSTDATAADEVNEKRDVSPDGESKQSDEVKENEEGERDKSSSDREQCLESETLAKELMKRGQRRSLRVKVQQEDTNETVKTVKSDLENWLPKVFKEAVDLDCKRKKQEPTENNKLKLEPVNDVLLLKEILNDKALSLIPLMKNYCNTLSRQFKNVWPVSVKFSFLKVYLSYREYEVLPNILQNFTQEDTEDNALTLLCAFEFIVNDNLLPSVPINDSVFNDLKEIITPSGLEKDQTFLRTTNNHEQIKNMFTNELAYHTFQIRFAWTNGLYEEKHDKIDCAIEFVKLCQKKLEESNIEEVIVANSSSQAINQESIDKKLKSLTDISDRDKVNVFFEEKDYARVVDILSPILDAKNNETPADASDESVPNRFKDLLILLESLTKLKINERCLTCCTQLLGELTPCIQFSEVWKAVLKKVFISLEQCLESISLDHIEQLRKIVHYVMKIIIAFFNRMNVLDDSDGEILLVGFPIGRAFKIYHMIINMSGPEDSSESSIVSMNVNKIQCLIYCHDTLGKHKLCSVNEGIFLDYAITCSLDYKSRNIFVEDATNIFEQAVFCYLCQTSTNSKRSKKNRVYHGASSVDMNLTIGEKIYNFYATDYLFEPFEKTKHLSADNFDLLSRIVDVFPDNITTSDQFGIVMKNLKAGTIQSFQPVESTVYSTFKNIYYICADYLFKYENFDDAIKWYISDLCINPKNPLSWLGIALCWLSITEDHLNQAKSDLNEILKSTTPKVVLCFDHYFQLCTPSFDASIEYSSFLYTLASIYSQVASLLNDSLKSTELIKNIASKRLASLCKAKELLTTSVEVEKPQSWVKMFMLGKISEKLNSSNLEWLNHYMKCFDHLKDFAYTLTKKINSGSPAEYSIECLEVSYRVAYSVFKRSMQSKALLKDEKVAKSLSKILSLMNVPPPTETDGLSAILKILEECHYRFPEHYKVRNALCNLYVRSSNEEYYKKASALMLQSQGSNGMFSFNRKHLFQNIWRIPVDAFDRPGGFFRHMRKSLSFLIVSLTHCRDEVNLMKLTENLLKTNEQIGNFVGEVNQFIGASIKSFDALIQTKISAYCAQNVAHTTEKSVEFLKTCMKAKSIHQKAGVSSRPVDESLLFLLWQFKLKDSQQMILYDKDALDNTQKISEIANSLISNYDQIQKMAKLLEIEKQRLHETKQKDSPKSVDENEVKEISVSLAKDKSASKDIEIQALPEKPKPPPEQPSSSKSQENQSSAPNPKIIVNESAKTAIRQAVASFITQIAEKNQSGQTKGKNVSQVLNNILMKSFQGKNKSSKTAETTTKIRQVLLNAAKQANTIKTKKDNSNTKDDPIVITENPVESSTKNSELSNDQPEGLKPDTSENDDPVKVSKDSAAVAEDSSSVDTPKDETAEIVQANSTEHSKPSEDVKAEQLTAKVSLQVGITPKPPKLQQKLSSTEGTNDKLLLSRSMSYPCPPQTASNVLTQLPNIKNKEPSPSSEKEDKEIKIEKTDEPVESNKESLKRQRSSSDSDSDGSDNDDEMPQLDDVPSVDTNNSKQSPPKPPPLQPPALARKTSAYASNINMPNPPPIYCRSSSYPGPSADMSANLIHLSMKHGNSINKAAMMESVQNMGLKAAAAKGRKTKTPRVKKETVKKPRPKKEPKRPKKSEKKRFDNEKRSLNQFDFSVEGELKDGGNKLQHLSHPPNTQSPMFSPTDNASKRMNTLMMSPYESHVPQNDVSDNLYKADDFFASGNSNPKVESFLGGSPKSHNDMYNQHMDGGIFSPNSSENHISDNVPDEDDVENVNLDVLNELDGCDFNEEQLVQPTKGKRGRKSKGPPKPKAPKKRKTKTKAQQLAEQQSMMQMGQVMNQNNKFVRITPPYGMYQGATPPMEANIKYEPSSEAMAYGGRDGGLMMNNSDGPHDMKSSPLTSPTSYNQPFTEAASPLTHFPEPPAPAPMLQHRTPSQFLPTHYGDGDMVGYANSHVKSNVVIGSPLQPNVEMSQRFMSPNQFVPSPNFTPAPSFPNPMPYDVVNSTPPNPEHFTNIPDSSGFLNSNAFAPSFRNY